MLAVQDKIHHLYYIKSAQTTLGDKGRVIIVLWDMQYITKNTQLYDNHVEISDFESKIAFSARKPTLKLIN